MFIPGVGLDGIAYLPTWIVFSIGTDILKDCLFLFLFFTYNIPTICVYKHHVCYQNALVRKLTVLFCIGVCKVITSAVILPLWGCSKVVWRILWCLCQVPLLGSRHKPGGARQGEDSGGWACVLWDWKKALYHPGCPWPQKLCPQHDWWSVTSWPGCVGESTVFTDLMMQTGHNV